MCEKCRHHRLYATGISILYRLLIPRGRGRYSRSNTKATLPMNHKHPANLNIALYSNVTECLCTDCGCIELRWWQNWLLKSQNNS